MKLRLKLDPFMVGFLAAVCLGFHCVDSVTDTRAPRPRRQMAPPPFYAPAVRAAAGLADPEAVQREVVDAYVEVQTPDGLGSGTVVDVGGEKLVLTAGHVVDKHERVTLFKRWKDGSTLTDPNCEVVARSGDDEDGGLDLALVWVNTPGLFKAARLLGDSPLHAGEDAWYCGSGGGIYQNLEKTIVNKVGHVPGAESTDSAVKTSFFLVNGNGYYGHSGSGVFVARDGQFRLAGVVLRLVRGYPKHPSLCREPREIARFIADYLAEEVGE